MLTIKYIGHSSFLIKGKDASVLTDPFDSEMVGIKFPKTEAEIVTVSHDHKDHNQTSKVTGMKKLISGPGEYDVAGVSIIGIKSFHDDSKGTERGVNTIYIIEIDDVRIAHMGDLGHELSEKKLSMIGDINILMIPVGGEYTVNAQTAAKITRVIEPNIIVPMHFLADKLNSQVFGKLTTADPFINDLGLPVEKTRKLNIKSESDLEEQKIILFEIS